MFKRTCTRIGLDYRGVACDVARVLHHYVCYYKYALRGYEINNNRTGTIEGGGIRSRGTYL